MNTDSSKTSAPSSFNKNAACHCGQLTVACEGEPMFVAMCHCEDCQRRTGSSYNLGAWYDRANVSIEGNHKVFQRIGDEGVTLRYHFCPECGSNIYWEASLMENAIGVAGGAFADPDFPQPSVSVYGKRRHRWLEVPKGIPCHLVGIGSELEP